MKLKLDEHGHVVVQDGKPVYTKDDGTEVAFDVAGTAASIARLNAEARDHRVRAETAEKTLKTFEGIEDPEAARKALQITANLDAKKLVDAGDVEKVRQEAIRAVEEKYKPVVDERDRLQGEIYKEKVGGAFARSKFIADECAIPADLVEARFAKHFKLEEGAVVGYDANGNKLYSDANPGQLATPDEALKMLVNQYQYKDQILKGSQASGAGAGTNQGAGAGAKTIKRADFDRLPAEQKQQTIASGVVPID